MKKRVWSLFVALALCLTLLPTAALAEETEGTAQTPPAVEEAADQANGEAKQEDRPAAPEQEIQSAAPEQENQSAEQEEQQEDSTVKQAVADVQAMIDDLPDAEALDDMDGEAQEGACLAASEAYDAYDALTEEQQSALTGAENMIVILEWANEQVALLADDVDVSKHTDHTDWTEISTEEGLKSLTGKGCLTDNITLTSTWEPQNGVVLCLNGYVITGANGQDVITVAVAMPSMSATAVPSPSLTARAAARSLMPRTRPATAWLSKVYSICTAAASPATPRKPITESKAAACMSEKAAHSK